MLPWAFLFSLSLAISDFFVHVISSCYTSDAFDLRFLIPDCGDDFCFERPSKQSLKHSVGASSFRARTPRAANLLPIKVEYRAKW